MMKQSIIILMLFSIIPLAYGEQYNYIENHFLSHPPEFCAVEFEEQIPNAKKILLEKTENAINKWEQKLQQYTNNYDGWDFSFRIITQEEYENSTKSDFCDIIILYKPQPESPEESHYLGIAYVSYLALYSEITIFYLEPVITTKKTFGEGEWKTFRNISTYRDNLDPYLDATIKHEIGHAFGLDHPKFLFEDYVEVNNVFHSPSIMVQYDQREPLRQLHYEITDYDLQSMINLYGEDGMNEFSIKKYTIEIIFGAVLAIGIFTMWKMSKKSNH